MHLSVKFGVVKFVLCKSPRPVVNCCNPHLCHLILLQPRSFKGGKVGSTVAFRACYRQCPRWARNRRRDAPSGVKECPLLNIPLQKQFQYSFLGHLFNELQKIQRLKLDAEEATHDNQAAESSPSGAGANDNERELHAFQVRGLVLEQTSIIVELSWSPLKASRALAQERVKERSACSVAVQPNIGKENDTLEDIELQNEGTSALAEIPSQEEVFSDLEAQVYSSTSKLRNGLYSRHVTGVSMPLLLSPSKTRTSTPRKRVTVLGTQSRGANSSNTSSSAQPQGSSLSNESSPVPPAMPFFELKRGSGEGRQGSLGRVDYDASHHLVQRCALMKVTSLQEQVLYLLMYSVH